MDNQGLASTVWGIGHRFGVQGFVSWGLELRVGGDSILRREQVGRLWVRASSFMAFRVALVPGIEKRRYNRYSHVFTSYGWPIASLCDFRYGALAYQQKPQSGSSPPRPPPWRHRPRH